MYLGVNYAVVVGTLDLEAVVTPRVPEGLLFGRNVTGGLVSCNHRQMTEVSSPPE